MKKFTFILLAGVLALAGCASGGGKAPLCEAAKIVAIPIVEGVAEFGECEGVDAMNAWVLEIAVKAGICEPEMGVRGVIGDIACPRVVDRVLAEAPSRILRPEFKCKLTKLKEGARPYLLDICRRSVPFSKQSCNARAMSGGA